MYTLKKQSFQETIMLIFTNKFVFVSWSASSLLPILPFRARTSTNLQISLK